MGTRSMPMQMGSFAIILLCNLLNIDFVTNNVTPAYQIYDQASVLRYTARFAHSLWFMKSLKTRYV